MHIGKIQNNNTSFGVKLIINKNMYPQSSIFEGDEKELLRKLVTSVETKTADKKGTLYVTTSQNINTNNINVFFKNDNYTDSIILYDKNKLNLCGNIEKYTNMILNLVDIFKMREDTTKTTIELQKQIEKLEQKIIKAKNELIENIKEKLPHRKTFLGESSDNNSFVNSVKEAENAQTKFLT